MGVPFEGEGEKPSSAVSFVATGGDIKVTVHIEGGTDEKVMALWRMIEPLVAMVAVPEHATTLEGVVAIIQSVMEESLDDGDEDVVLANRTDWGTVLQSMRDAGDSGDKHSSPEEGESGGGHELLCEALLNGQPVQQGDLSAKLSRERAEKPEPNSGC